MNSPTDSMSPRKAKKLSCLIAFHGAAVTGAHRIDENKISLVKPGLFVIDQLIRRRRHHAIGLHAHAFGTDSAHVKPYRSGARAAIERESERPVLVLAVERIGDKEDVRFNLAGVIVLERHHSRGGGVMQRLAADMDFMVGNYWWNFSWFFLCFGGGSAGWLGLFSRTGCGRRAGGRSPRFLWPKAQSEKTITNDQERRGATQHMVTLHH